jgi:hypothetical protein
MPFVQLIGFVSSRKTNEKLQKLQKTKYCDNCDEKLSGEAFAPTDETVVCAECWENIKLGRSLHFVWGLAHSQTPTQTQTQTKKQTNAEELADIMSFLGEMKIEGDKVIAPLKKTQPKKQTNAEELADIMSFLGEMKGDGNKVIFAPLKN